MPSQLLRRILVPIDGSEGSAQALRVAVTLLRGRQGELVLLAVANVEEVLGESLDPAKDREPLSPVGFTHILVAVDDSEAADAAVELGVEIAAHEAAALTDTLPADASLHEPARQMVEHALRMASAAGVAAEGKVLEGSAIPVLVTRPVVRVPASEPAGAPARAFQTIPAVG